MLPEELIGVTNGRGGKDNVTVVVVRAENEARRVDLDRTEKVGVQLEVLKALPFFQYLRHREILAVVNICEARSLEENEQVITEGEADDSLYVILDGRLEVSRGGAVIATLEIGSHFGEMALLSARPRSASVRAVVPSRVFVIHRVRLFDLIKKDPTLGVKLLWCLARGLSLRLDDTSEELSGARTLVGDLQEVPF
jgi:CRP-like cAMP-binding protein